MNGMRGKSTFEFDGSGQTYYSMVCYRLNLKAADTQVFPVHRLPL
ncbi:hypothetical protein PRIO_0634 [Paenibacillus riograndensis SBR5]|uniref:Uncharacterized protein n=1 Tax=Paenibacillus riograndensis SBR5 TaxID=1073571 RepID=A0A0E4H7G3_9BACL|nr:hypothetical protein PRIO_0634 [Paenibacillus riograndensis SBR5]